MLGGLPMADGVVLPWGGRVYMLQELQELPRCSRVVPIVEIHGRIGCGLCPKMSGVHVHVLEWRCARNSARVCVCPWTGLERRVRTQSGRMRRPERRPRCVCSVA
mmetsp:Transcript_37916/g.100812  ORF Transcript_37916/g.100812 Transcript_37916/m.100812 type:complete len:105 (+) Transcript_37916:205-519(+)